MLFVCVNGNLLVSDIYLIFSRLLSSIRSHMKFRIAQHFYFFISQQTLYFGNFQIVPPLALSMKGSVTKHWQFGLFQRGVLICNVQHELCCQCHTGGWYFWTWINKPKSTLIYNYRKKIVNVLLNQWSHVQMCFLDQRDVTRIPEKWRNVIQSQNESFQKIKVLANINV